MRPTTLASTIKSYRDMPGKRALYITGSPGIGKTSVPRQVAAELGLGFIPMHAPTMQPEDMALPCPSADRTQLNFIVNSRFPLEGNACPDEGILLIDELPQGDASVQKTMANLFQEREIFGRRLKPGWSIVATGNRQIDRAGASKIFSHLNDRMTEVEYEVSLDDWSNWALDSGIRVEVIQFCRFKANALNDFDPQRTKNATPRGWCEGVSPVIDNVAKEAEFECFKGAVGEGWAAEFTGFLKIFRKLPNPDAVLMQPDTYDVPEEASVRYAMAGALAQRATSSNFEAVITYMKRFPAEFTVLSILDSVRKDKTLQATKAFTQWAAKEGAAVLS